MKRYISLILILSLCLSFAACSVKNDSNTDGTELSTEIQTTSLPKPDLDVAEYSKDFTDENGRVVYTVKANLPKITGNIPDDIADYLNGVFYSFFEDACESAESNIENATAFMDNQNSQKPWIKSLDYNINLSDGKYFSFTIKDSFSMFGNPEVEPSLTGYVFDIIKGVPCTIRDFMYENSSHDSVKQVLADEFIYNDVAKVLFNDTPLNDEQKEIVFEVFDLGNFYLTDTGIGFYFSSNSINPNYFDTFVTHYTWEDVAVVLKRNN